MSEFKGTTENLIIENGFIAIESKEYAIAKVYVNQFVCERTKEANANLIVDAFKVRQQINCELSELKEQRDEMLAMLELLIDRLQENDLGQLNAVDRGKQLIKKVKDNE